LSKSPIQIRIHEENELPQRIGTFIQPEFHLSNARPWRFAAACLRQKESSNGSLHSQAICRADLNGFWAGFLGLLDIE
jgi:hypothetical protein